MPLFSGYADELRKEMGMFVTFPPGQFALGDYGEVCDGAFVRRGNIQDLSAIVVAAAPGSAMDRLEYKSAGKVQVAVGAGGDLGSGVAAPRAKTKISFSSKHAVLLSGADCTYATISNLQEVQAEIVALERAGVWESQWRIVTGVVNAASTTLLISSEAGASIEVELVAGVPTAALAGGDAKFNVTSEQNIGCQFLALKDAVPLVTLSRLARRFWKPKTLRQMAAGTAPPAEAAADDMVLVVVERDDVQPSS